MELLPLETRELALSETELPLAAARALPFSATKEDEDDCAEMLPFSSSNGFEIVEIAGGTFSFSVSDRDRTLSVGGTIGESVVSNARFLVFPPVVEVVVGVSREAKDG